MRKILLSIISMMICAGVYSNATTIDGITYTLSSGTGGNTAEVTSVEASGDVVIKSSITVEGVAYSVTSIAKNALAKNEELTSVTIPETVVSVGFTGTNIYKAFSGCKGLQEINVAAGNTVFASDNGILYNADKTELLRCPEGKTGNVEIDANNLTSVSAFAFSNCAKIETATFTDGLLSVGNQAFENCSSLKSVSLPYTVNNIGTYAFLDCTSLVSISVEEGNSTYKTKDGVLFNAGGQELISYPAGKSGEYVIDEGVTRIYDNAFLRCGKLTKVSLPSTLTDMGEYAFNYCTALTEVVIPGSVAQIRNYAFLDCTSLKTVTIMEGVQEIGPNTFQGCTSLEKAEIPSTVSEISQTAFKDCTSLSDLTVADGNASFKSIDGVIYSADMKTLVKCVQAKEGELIIPDEVEIIAQQAMNECDKLTSVVIGSGVKNINASAFSECVGLKRIVSKNATPPTCANSNVFTKVTAVVYVPKESIDDYESAPVWSALNIKCGINIDANANDETAGKAIGGGLYDYGEEVELTAIENEGYHFAGWHDGNQEKKRTVIVTEEMTFVAMFEAGTDVEEQEDRIVEKYYIGMDGRRQNQVQENVPAVEVTVRESGKMETGKIFRR